MSQLGDLVVRIGADVSGFAAGMSTVSGQLSAIDKEATKAGAGFTRFGSFLTSIGMGVTTAVTLPILGAGLVVTKFASDFELGMRKVTSLIGGATQKEFADLSAATLKLAKDMGIDAVGATDALYEAISAGIPKDNALAFVEVASKAAIAGVTDAKIAVNALTTMIAAYGMKTSEAGKLADAMFQAVNIGKFQFADLAASIGPAAQMSSALGVSYQELLGATATLSITTGSAEKAVTQVESAMRALLNPTAEMSAAFKAIGVESGSAAIKAFGFEGTLQKLRVATGGNVEAFTQLFGRIEGSQGALGLTGDKAAQAAKDLDTMRHSSDGLGASTVAYNEINKSTQRQLEITITKLKSIAIEMGQSLLPAVNSLLKASAPLLDMLSGIASWFAKLPSGVQTAIISILAASAAVGPMTTLVGQASIAIGGLAKAIALLPAGTLLLTSAFSGLAPAIGSVVVALQAGMVGALTAGELALLGIGSALAVAGAAFAGWKLGEWIYNMDIANDTLRGLRDAIYGVDSAARDMAKKGMVSAEASAEKLRVKLASLGVIVPRGAMDINAYSDALFHTATQYGKTSASVTKQAAVQDAAQKSAKQLKDETDRLNKANEGYAKGLEYMKVEEQKRKTTLFELAMNTRAATVENDMMVENIRTGLIPAADAVNTGIKAVDDRFKVFRQSLIDSDFAEKEMKKSMDELAKAGPPVSDALKGILDAAEKSDIAASGINKLGDAMKRLGITTSTSLKQAVADAQKDYQDMADSGGATTYELQQAWVKLLEAEKAAAQAVGTWTDEQEKAYRASKGILDGMEGDVKKVESAWKKMGDSVKDALKGFQSNINTGLISSLFGIDRRAFNKDLDAQAADLNQSLAAQTSEWDKYQVSATQSLVELRSNAQKELDGGAADLVRSLQDAGMEWKDYAANATKGLDKFRADNAKDLAGELGDLKKNLTDRTKQYTLFVRDINTAMGRTTADSADSIDEKTTDTKRGIADQTTEYERYQRDTLERIAELTAADATGNAQQILDLRQSLGDKKADLDLYISRATEDLVHFTADAKIEEDRKLADLKTSLADQTAEYDLFVATNVQQMTDATSTHAAKLAEEEAAVAASLDARKAEYETFKTDAVAKFETLKTDIAAKLTAEETDLAASLAARKTEYDTYVADINTKLTQLKEDHRTIWDDIGATMKGAFTSLGAEIARVALEELEGKLIKSLWGMMSSGGVLESLGSAFGGLGTKISDALGGGGGYGVTDAAKLPGAAGSAAGGAASGGGGGSSAGGAGGWMGIVDMVTGAVTAVSSVVSNVQNMKIEATLSLIEESTRYTWILLNGLMATKLTEAADRLGWGGGPASGIFDRVLKLYDLMDGMDRVEALIRDNLVPDLKAISAASSGPRISIVNNIDGNVIGNADFLDSLANALIGKLRLQGVTA